MIRCLDVHGVPIAVYAIEIDGMAYALDEVERIVVAYEAGEPKKRRTLPPICVCGHWRHLHDKVCSTCGCTNYRQAQP